MKTTEAGSKKYAIILEIFETRPLIINHRKFLVQIPAFQEKKNPLLNALGTLSFSKTRNYVSL